MFNAKEFIMELSAIVTPATEGGYVAFNPETGTTTQGETIEEALANLREATELYLEEFPLIQSGRSLLTTFQVATHA
jgi:predicted RNase H-like HicB family nuclease